MPAPVIARKRASLGASLRSIRLERGWTIAVMSEVTGISKATLSKVENDRRSLTYDKLLRLALSLKVDISRLFGVETQDERIPLAGRRSVARQSDGTVMDAGVYTYTYQCQDLIKKLFSPTMMDLHAASIGEFHELLRHEGEEYAYVIEGEVILHTDAYAPLHLSPGDAVYFDSRVGHAFVNAGKGNARILNIASHAIGAQDQASPSDRAGAADRPSLADRAEPKAHPRRARASR